jgi:predicted O-methyltransferase YrrM
MTPTSEENVQTAPPQDDRVLQALKLRRLVRAIPAEERRRAFVYDRGLLPNDFLRKMEEGITDIDSAMPRTGITPGYPSWNLLYFSLLTSMKPGAAIVETGTHRGISTIVLAQAVKDSGFQGMVNTVDINPALVEIAKRNVAEAGLSELVEFNLRDSAEFLRDFARQSQRIDFAFLDGDHSFGQVRAEFEAIRESVAACGGKIFFDNTANGGVAEALRYIRANYGGNLIEFQNCSWGPHGNVIWQA